MRGSFITVAAEHPQGTHNSIHSGTTPYEAVYVASHKNLDLYTYSALAAFKEISQPLCYFAQFLRNNASRGRVRLGQR